MRIPSWEVGVSPESVAGWVSKGSCASCSIGVWQEGRGGAGGGRQGLHVSWVALQGMQEVAYEATWGAEGGGTPR